MKYILAFFLIFLTLFIFSRTAFAESQKWFYPMPDIVKRSTIKGFGMYIDENFYKIHGADFPNHFLGFHTGVDLETLPSEKEDSVNVPVYFITSGTISYIGNLSGYGGVVLLKLDGTSDTALYGHVKISGIKYKVGQHVDVTSPTVLTYLGNGFSSETSGERKHLHFGIYRGQDLYFHGHEQSKSVLEAKWYSPLDYLKSQNAVPINFATPTISQPVPSEMPKVQVKNQSFFEKLILKFRSIFRK